MLTSGKNGNVLSPVKCNLGVRSHETLSELQLRLALPSEEQLLQRLERLSLSLVVLHEVFQAHHQVVVIRQPCYHPRFLTLHLSGQLQSVGPIRLEILVLWMAPFALSVILVRIDKPIPLQVLVGASLRLHTSEPRDLS
jgi:hypothetical protein